MTSDYEKAEREKRISNLRFQIGEKPQKEPQMNTSIRTELPDLARWTQMRKVTC